MSPDARDSVLVEGAVGTDHGYVLDEGLCDEKPVERVTVVARNRAIDLGRQWARRPEQLEAGVQDRDGGLAADTADLALEQLSTERALRLVAALPPAVAEMVALRVIVGLDVAQVAQIVDKTPGAVRVAVHRGLRTLAAQLERGTPTPM